MTARMLIYFSLLYVQSFDDRFVRLECAYSMKETLGNTLIFLLISKPTPLWKQGVASYRAPAQFFWCFVKLGGCSIICLCSTRCVFLNLLCLVHSDCCCVIVVLENRTLKSDVHPFTATTSCDDIYHGKLAPDPRPVPGYTNLIVVMIRVKLRRKQFTPYQTQTR